MKDSFLIDCLKTYFDMEISNKFIFGENKIIVFLEDGSRAIITTNNAV